MITIPLRILLVEDNRTDADLTIFHIQKIVETSEIRVVDNLDDVNKELLNFVPDVVISDYNLPTCTGLDVLQLIQERNPELPVIFLTGTIHDEELAANTILAGASGYILKKDMNNLEEKLRPLLKKVVFKMDAKDEVRERLRQNRIAINQIYDYLDNLKLDNKEQKENMGKIKKSIRNFEIGNDDDDKEA